MPTGVQPPDRDLRPCPSAAGRTEREHRDQDKQDRAEPGTRSGRTGWLPDRGGGPARRRCTTPSRGGSPSAGTRSSCTPTPAASCWTDPAGREMIISCGAALFGLRLAIRSLGYQPEVDLFPDPGQRRLLARVRPGRPSPVTADERAMLRRRAAPAHAPRRVRARPAAQRSARAAARRRRGRRRDAGDRRARAPGASKAPRRSSPRGAGGRISIRRRLQRSRRELRHGGGPARATARPGMACRRMPSPPRPGR